MGSTEDQGGSASAPHRDVIESLVESRAWRHGQLVDPSVTPEEIAQEVSDPDTLVWIDLLQPTLADLQAVVGRIGLPPTAVEDVLGPRERPKVVRHEDWVYVTTYAVSLESDGAAAARDADERQGSAGAGHRLLRCRVSAIATSSALVTIRLDPRWDMADVVRRWEEDPGLIRRGVGALLHGLLDVIVDQHFDVIQALDDESEALEDVLLAQNTTDDTFIFRVYALRKQLVELRRVVVPMRDVVSIIQRSSQSTGTEMSPWWGDLYDHVLRAAEWTESLRDMIAFLVETQMSLLDWRLNTVMKKLAGWAAIIAVPTAITGWFGQNVPFPGSSVAAGVWLSAVLVVVTTTILYWSFKRRDWL